MDKWNTDKTDLANENGLQVIASDPALFAGLRGDLSTGEFLFSGDCFSHPQKTRVPSQGLPFFIFNFAFLIFN
jgi:hypothetical protein